MSVFVLDTNRKPLDPTNHARARRLLKQKRAAIFRRSPFTIILKNRTLEESVVREKAVWEVVWDILLESGRHYFGPANKYLGRLAAERLGWEVADSAVDRVLQELGNVSGLLVNREGQFFLPDEILSRYSTGRPPEVGDYVEGGRFYGWQKDSKKRGGGVVMKVDFATSSLPPHSLLVHRTNGEENFLDPGPTHSFRFVREATEEEFARAVLALKGFKRKPNG